MKVNNAGFVLGVERVGDINPDDIEAMFATNVFGLIAVTQALIKGVVPQRSISPRLMSFRLQGAKKGSLY